MLSSNIDKKNKEIFKYLKDENYLPSFNRIDEDMGWQKSYSYKFADLKSKETIKPIHTYAFEAKYHIPSSLFFNPKIETKEDIVNFIDAKRFEGQYIKNESPHSLEYLKKFKYLYVLSEDKYVYEYIYKIDGLNISIKSTDSEREYRGNIQVTSSAIIIILINLVTRATSVLKFKLVALVEDTKAIPFSHLSQKASTGEERCGYGIVTHEKFDKEMVRKILDLGEIEFNTQFREIIKRIKEENLY